jgi:FAD/FMN-containing dehydrogenase
MGEPSDRQTVEGNWKNWAGDEGCRPRAIVRPQSTKQIAEALDRAASEDWRVRVAGAGHSFSDVACSEGMLISLDCFGAVLDVDRDSGLVRVQGGLTIAALNVQLARHGLALENLGDIDVQSVAGAISTATHGTGARLRNISSQVAELKLVLADGSTLVCSPDGVGERSGGGSGGAEGAGAAGGDGKSGDGDLLRAARVGLGALGVVAEVTLRCVPAFTLRGIDAPAPLADTLERFEELASANDHFEFFVFPHCDTALTRTNNRTDEPPRPRGKAAAWLNDVLLTNHAFGAFCALGRALPSQIPRINHLVTKLAGTSKRIDRSDRVFASPRLVRFTEMEYSLPRERTPEAVRAVMDLIERRGFAVPFPIEVRTVAPDDAMLSTAYGRESGFVAVHMYRGMQWRPYFEAVEQIFYELGGRPHWGKRHFQTEQTLRPRYPEWDAFQAIRARLDPDGRFTNAWTDRVLGPVGVRAVA